MPKVKGIIDKEDEFDCLIKLGYFDIVYIGIKGRFIQISIKEDFLSGQCCTYLNEISDSIVEKYCEPSPRYHRINLMHYQFSKIRKQIIYYVLESTDFYE